MKRFVLLFLTTFSIGIGAFSQVAGFEYFLDIDPGLGKGIAINQSVDESGLLQLSTAGMPTGSHYLVIRAKDATGKWSIAESRPIYIQPVEPKDTCSLIGYEYFVDSDPGIGKGKFVSIASSHNFDLNQYINADNFTEGSHLLCIRFFNKNGKASITESRPIYVTHNPSAPANIVALEYSFDTLGVFGSGTIINVEPNSLIEEDLSIPYADLVKGSHTLYMRAKDSKGVWSMPASTIFSVVNNSAPLVSNQTFSVNENSPKDTKIGKINATDPDGNTLTYSITQGNEKAVFSINTSGEMIVNDPTYLDFETNPLFTLTVSVSDGIATVNSTITVNLINVIEVGINEKFLSTINCYPNPSKGIFVLTGFNQDENCKLEVYTPNGKLIYRRENINSQTEVDISNETNGIYLLKITSNKKAITKKIIVNKSIN
jgi:hypothetical protein